MKPVIYLYPFVANCVFLALSYGQSSTSVEAIIDPNSKVREVFAGGEGVLLEGPAMSPEGILYFTDITVTDVEGMKAGIIWTYDPKTGDAKVFRSPSGMANGLIFDRDGNLIACEGADFGGRRIVKTDMKTGKSIILAGLFNERPFNAPNDLVSDNMGRIYFTDPRYFGRESIDQPVDGIYRIDTDGSVHLVSANAGKPNGIAISPDQKKLYVVNLGRTGISGSLPGGFEGPKPAMKGSVLEYSLLPDGTVAYLGVLIDFQKGGPDGMTVDSDGNLYLALLDGSIGVYSPKGEKLTEIRIPENVPSNLCFGTGQWSNTLFITARKTLYQVKIKKKGIHSSLIE
jgi:gluconolactonase